MEEEGGDEEDEEMAGEDAATAAALGGAGNPLNALRQQPQFQQLRQLVQQQPHLLPAILQQIGQTNPQLLQVCARGCLSELILPRLNR